MIIAGIDGCRKGWIMIYHEQKQFGYGMYSTFSELLSLNPALDRILIDMPIGLSSKAIPRTIDKVIRKELPGRASTVFNAPCRAAVYAKNNEEAKLKNIQAEGKSLSIQSLALREKIKEIDQYVTKSQGKGVEIIESHPELCFKYLTQDHQVLMTKKSKRDGIKFRLDLLLSYKPELENLYEYILKQHRRYEVKRDDILDAMCLCLVNKLSAKNGMKFLVGEEKVDEKGVDMRIGYYI